MCTFDTKFKKVMSANKSVIIIAAVFMLFAQMAASWRKPAFDDAYMENLIKLSAPEWKDVKDADQWVHELRGE